METKNYAELSSLKWRVEDININVERAYDAGYITEERMNKLLSMTDTDKIAFFEGVTAVQHQNSYGVFCMTDRMLANGYKIYALDDFWADAITEYNKFLNSEFNVDSKSELDCIDDYFSNQ